MTSIGIFDSGVGGLTVARAVLNLIPNESIVYFGDTARAPYGSNSPEQVLEDANRVARHLVEEFDVKMLVVACNTTASVLRRIWGEGVRGESTWGKSAWSNSDWGNAQYENLDAGHLELGGELPIVEILTPGAQALIEAAEGGRRRVGVIATETTIASGAYQKVLGEAIGQANGQINGRAWDLSFVACPGFVEFAEQGETDTPDLRTLAHNLLAPLKEAQVEKLLLGCSHFPFLTGVIQDVLGAEVELVSSAEATAAAVCRELESLSLSESGDREINSADHRWLVSGESDNFQAVGRDLLGLPIQQVEFAEALAPKVHLMGAA